MSRMMITALLGFLTFGVTHATDIEKFPPGHMPFKSPRCPQPEGVFAPGSCYGFHATRWTPWQAACANCGSEATGQSCGNRAIIMFDDMPAAQGTTTPAPSTAAPGAVAPAPEAAKPMPPVKK